MYLPPQTCTVWGRQWSVILTSSSIGLESNLFSLLSPVPVVALEVTVEYLAPYLLWSLAVL